MLPEKINYTYDLAVEQLPSPRAQWHLQPERSALLVHDMQAYFARIYHEQCPALRQAVATIAELISAARSAQVPIFYTAQPGDQDPAERGLLCDLWGPGLGAAAEQTSILEALAPQGDDVVLTKHRYSAFARSDFEDQLFTRGRDQLVITGIYAHIGVATTATDAFMRDIAPFVVADAVADFTLEDHRRALHTVARTSGQVVGSELVLQTWQAGHSDPLRHDPLFSDLSELLDAPRAHQALTHPSSDLFELGLDSLRAFELLDRIAERGVEIDYAVFVREATVAHLRRAGVLEPAS